MKLAVWSAKNEFSVRNLLDVKLNDEHDFGFALRLSRFKVPVSLDLACKAHAFFPERLSDHCQGSCDKIFRDLHKM
jgi:hypothetical protein